MSRSLFAKPPAMVLGALVALSSASLLAQGRPDLVEASMQDPKKNYVPGELIVQFRRGASDAGIQAAVGRIGARIHEDIRPASQRHDGKGDLHLVRLPVGLTVASAMSELRFNGAVDFAEPNWIYRRQDLSNDTNYTDGSLWGMYGDANGLTMKNPFGSQAAEAWIGGTSCGTVVVGIIDEGFMTTHPELKDNVWVNPGEIPGNGIDDDGNGYIDDINGWDFDGDNNSVFDGVNDDHGTHVAGTIGALGGNGTGVAGMCWQIKMISAKFLGNLGGTTANAIKAVDYLTDLKTRLGLNLVASNNSWGGGGFSQALADAITRAGTAQILFVAAAGNDGRSNDTTPSYPSSYKLDNIIAVASITSTGALSGFSNYGVGTVHIGAPGSAIWSTVPLRNKRKTVAGYASYSGTSMATPHVTGAIAMYAFRRGQTDASRIKAGVLGAALATGSLSGKVMTGGRLDVSGF